MDQGAAKVIAHEVLGGVFDVVGAIAEAPFKFTIGDMTDADPEALSALQEILPACIRATISGGGELALFFASPDIARMLAIVENTAAPKTDIDTNDLARFDETANSMLSAGVVRFARAIGEDLGIQEISLALANAGTSPADGLAPATLVNFRFQSAPQFNSMAALLISQALEGRVPNELVDSYSDEEDMDQAKLVSDAEMQDILSGFGADNAETPATPADLQGNLDVIMDIELLATVRLGSIEMPLAEVLRLGPGSIIEVGHMVDDPVELLVNGKLVARGDVVVVDEKFGLRITEIVSRKERIESLR